MKFIVKWIWNILIALDQLLNAIFFGDPDETISSRCGKRILNKEKCILCKALCKFLNLLDTHHCKEAIEKDEGRDSLI